MLAAARHARIGRRNCNVNLDELRWDRPDLDCEPQQARVIPRNLQVDETVDSRRATKQGRLRPVSTPSVAAPGATYLFDVVLHGSH